MNEDQDFENVDLPDGDENIEEEKGHDPEKAEKQSIDSVDATDGVVKKAPSRKLDSKKQDPKQSLKSKSGMLNAMYSKMASMNKEALTAMYSKVSEDFDDVEIDEKKEELPESSYDFSEELTDLVESEATLSEEFKSKTAIIFETAIRSKIATEVGRLEDEYQERLSEEIETTRTDLVENVDNYLNYVVENWMEENQVAVETGLRAEIAEDFMSNLKELFVESYIEVPESKIDLVDELAGQVEELEEKLNGQTESVITMSEELESYKRATVIREHSRDLAETEVEKLMSLVESLDFEDEDTFSAKVKTVKESYFKKESTEIVDETQDDFDEETVAPSAKMAQYVQSLRGSRK
jgi:hypothetical protein